MFRYIHSHSLYGQDTDGIQSFMEDLLNALDIQSDKIKFDLYDSCMKIVKNSATKWKRLGFLFREEGVLRRTEDFEAAWSQRRAI